MAANIFCNLVAFLGKLPCLPMGRKLRKPRIGKPWIMRRRTTAEMDELVRTAGFEKVTMEVDEWGIFTVSSARRLPA